MVSVENPYEHPLLNMRLIHHLLQVSLNDRCSCRKFRYVQLLVSSLRAEIWSMFQSLLKPWASSP